jgi:hypothetical protein
VAAARVKELINVKAAKRIVLVLQVSIVFYDADREHSAGPTP